MACANHTLHPGFQPGPVPADPTALDNTAVKAGFMCLGGKNFQLGSANQICNKNPQSSKLCFLFLLFPAKFSIKKKPQLLQEKHGSHISTMGNPLQNSEFSSLLDSIFKSNLSFLSKTPIARIAYFKPSFYMLHKYIYTYRFAMFFPLFCFGFFFHLEFLNMEILCLIFPPPTFPIILEFKWQSKATNEESGKCSRQPWPR